MHQPATVTVRELARHTRVLNLISEAHGSLLRRANRLSAEGVARTAFGVTRPRRVEERLWLAPVRGLSAIGPLSVPEAVRRHNVRAFAALTRDWLGEIGAQRCVLLFYWWSLPELVPQIPHAVSIYDCTDDHGALPGGLVGRGTVARLEGRLLDAVDQSFVVSSGLLDDRAGPGRRIGVLPNAFDGSLFGTLQRTGFPAVPALEALPGPVIGYAGTFNSRMDWPLVETLARRRPGWSFAFVGGPLAEAPASLRALPNVAFVGPMPYPQALGAMSRFDVATIPARVSRFSRGNSFLKLLDSFAHGTPVVATPLPGTVDVADAHPDAVRLARGPDEWQTALEAALREPAGSQLRQTRRHLAETNDIRHRVERMFSEAFAAVDARG
jgi:glycosyltransferase involved in cell wall biosynthesis